MFDLLRALRAIYRTYSLLPGRRSDLARWGDETNLSARWDSRTAMMARLVPPGSKVLEFGAGRLTLKDHLPRGCTYTASDLFPREGIALVCDLNAHPFPKVPSHDVVFLAGVLAYVWDLPALVRFLSGIAGTVIASYPGTDLTPGTLARRANGWVNDLSFAELEKIFEEHGYAREGCERWERQHVYKFTKRP